MQINWIHKIDVLELGEEILTPEDRRNLVDAKAEKFGLACRVDFDIDGCRESNPLIDTEEYFKELSVLAKTLESASTETLKSIVAGIAKETNRYINSYLAVDDSGIEYIYSGGDNDMGRGTRD